MRSLTSAAMAPSLVCASSLRGWLKGRYLPWCVAALAMLLCAPSLWLGWQSESAPGDALRELPGTLTRPHVSHSTGREIITLVRTSSTGATVLSKLLKVIETTVVIR